VQGSGKHNGVKFIPQTKVLKVLEVRQ